MNKFDISMAKHQSTLIAGQEIIINALIKEIRDYKYTTIAQVNDSLVSHLERLKGEQYEIDANLDHVTEQIPNV